MTLTPELLLSTAARRLRDVRPDLADLDLSSPECLQAAKKQIADRSAAEHRDEASVVAVINRFRLDDWVRETCRFALSLPSEQAERWRRSFTRTIYLAGRPDNLQERFSFAHIAADGSAAWTGPAVDGDTAALRRLLKTFNGPRPLAMWSPMTVEVPGPDTVDGTDPTHETQNRGPKRPERRSVHRDLYVATAGLTVADVLVQLNHHLAEAVLDSLVAPGDHLTLHSVPRLPGPPTAYAALRVDTDIRRPHALQAYAGLTEET